MSSGHWVHGQNTEKTPIFLSDTKFPSAPQTSWVRMMWPFLAFPANDRDISPQRWAHDLTGPVLSNKGMLKKETF